MKPVATFVLLVAVFVVATFATGFGAALIFPPDAAQPFIARLWHHAISLGWGAGVVITMLFWLTLFLRKKGDPS